METKGLTGRALGEAVIDHVLTYPEKHAQYGYACGSTACIAGWTILLGLGVDLYSDQLGTCFEAAIEGHDNAGPGSLAAELLGLDHDRLRGAVINEMNCDTAIANFKHLLDETYSEQI